MKLLLLCLLATAVSLGAQPSPYRVLQPIMKNPNQRQAPSSVTAQDLDSGPGAPPTAPQVIMVAPQKPVEIVAKIDAGLAVSKITVIGRVTGIKGTLYVTNLMAETAIPHAQFAVCDRNGFQIGVASRIGSALAPSSEERLDVVATNVGSVDLKLVKLSGK
jgi:hypothetical protein